MALERLHRNALQRRADAGADLHALHRLALLLQLRKQLAREMRRHALARVECLALQRTRGEQVKGIARGGLRLAHLLEHTAGTLRHQRRPGVRRTHQGGRHGRLALVKAMGCLAEQGSRQGVDAHQFATERHQVEVGLKDLVLAPAPVEHLRSHGLPEFLHDAATATALAPVSVEQPGQLHGDGARPARALVPQVAPGRGRYRAPVHPAVLEEALVLAQHQCRTQRWRHIRDRNPIAAPHGGIGAHALQGLPLARQHQCFRRAEILPHFVIARHGPHARRAAQRCGGKAHGAPGRALPGYGGQTGYEPEVHGVERM